MPKVFHFISYRIEDNSTAEDLTSIVFEKALTRFRTYRSDKAGFSTWLFSIARNTIIDHFRLGHKDRMSVLDDLPEPAYIGTSPEEAVIKSEDFRRLQALLLNLPEPTQRIISLKFGAEMNNRQIAKMLGVSESNVANVLFRAVRMLRDNFKGWQDD
jgi:RNA polymerase sigma-70 factor, ECF subfamily